MSEHEHKPSVEQSEVYLGAFDYLNKALFGGRLSRPMLVFSRNKQIVSGHFVPHAWEREDGTKVHEIAINSNLMQDGDLVDLMDTLVHEMVHQEQHEHGKPTRSGYHNKEWCEWAVRVGLQPIDPKTKEPITSGQAADTRLIEGGPFEKALLEMPEDVVFPWISKPVTEPETPGEGGEGGKGRGKGEGQPRSGKRSKYTCPKCGLRVWAKAGARIACIDCDGEVLVEALAEGEEE